MRVDCYYNIHKKVLSVRAREDFKAIKNGRVFCHRKGVIINDVSFVVNQKGRERVLKENRKNVHAFIRGEFNYDLSVTDAFSYTDQLAETAKAINQEKAAGSRLIRVKYNPCFYDSFVNELAPDIKVIGAEKVFILYKVIYAKNAIFGS